MLANLLRIAVFVDVDPVGFRLAILSFSDHSACLPRRLVVFVKAFTLNTGRGVSQQGVIRLARPGPAMSATCFAFVSHPFL